MEQVFEEREVYQINVSPLHTGTREGMWKRRSSINSLLEGMWKRRSSINSLLDSMGVTLKFFVC
jgi:hypothetical protein